MAIDRYFTFFPITEYNSQKAVDITKKAVLKNNILKNPYLFYPYEISDNERADQFANRYYEDQYKAWIVYLSNNIIDPYYEWYLSQDEFLRFIAKKYGSVNLAVAKIKHYINNWENTENISISRYNVLPPTLKKYWTADYQNSPNIMSYKRKQSLETLNTNSVRAYAVANNSFIKDEIVNVVFNNNNRGKGQVVSNINNVLYIQHTSGVTLANNSVPITSNSYVYGEESLINVAFTSSTNIVDNLLPEEVVYWTPVTYFEYESTKNEYNKTIKILDKAYSKTISLALEEKMKE